MTPWRAMILAPLFAVLMIVVAVNAPDIVASLQAMPLLGPIFQKAINPKATGTRIMVSVLCPAIPALFAVALYPGVLISSFVTGRLNASGNAEKWPG